MNRPIILAKLAHLAQAGHVKFYPSVTAKTLDDLFNATQQETAMEKAISRSADQPAREKPASRREASRRSAGDQSSIVDQLTRLAEEHGRLAERLRISEESQTDLESRLGWYEEKIALLEERTLKLTLELDNLKKPPLPPAPETPQSKTRGWNVRSILFFFL